MSIISMETTVLQLKPYNQYQSTDLVSMNWGVGTLVPVLPAPLVLREKLHSAIFVGSKVERQQCDTWLSYSLLEYVCVLFVLSVYQSISARVGFMYSQCGFVSCCAHVENICKASWHIFFFTFFSTWWSTVKSNYFFVCFDDVHVLNSTVNSFPHLL